MAKYSTQGRSFKVGVKADFFLFTLYCKIINMKNIQEHYYILPNGKRVENMKEAGIALNLAGTALRSLIKKGIIKKILINISKANGYDRRTTNPINS